MCHPSLKKTIIRSSYNIHCQIICEVVIEVVIVLTSSFSKKAFVRAFSLKMPNDINPKFQHQKVKNHTTSKLLNPIIFAIKLQQILQQDCKIYIYIYIYLFDKSRFPSSSSPIGAKLLADSTPNRLVISVNLSMILV